MGPLAKRVISSFNIDVRGNLLSNPWSYDPSGKPYDSAVMGDLKKDKLSRLTSKTRVGAFFAQLKQNGKNES